MSRSGFCKACRLNRTIPDLTQSRNLPLWLAIERAKRRLVAQLIRLALPVASKVHEDPDRGVAYDFLRSVAGRPQVMTGHCRGIITINLEEADDAVRERIRVDMGEPYRTLLGHFRHEIGHYYWYRLIAGTDWQAECRQLFGDERVDYDAALRTNYNTGPPHGWRTRFISAYASAHPAEDWAESWAHYLHVRDTLDTADSAGIEASADHLESEPFGVADLWQPQRADAQIFVRMLNRWVRITGVMNEMSRAMGLHDFYPFILPRPAVAKLHLIHSLVQERSRPGEGAPPLVSHDGFLSAREWWMRQQCDQSR
ncbi:MAG TPA: putative zinc-binding metallopeptidase [Burkholderiaceae bacterium]|nr:putative zinc-binding metallopeptidase [Burkholderiaceae bacterium]